MPNSKRKGNIGEHKFSNFLQSHGFKAYKNSSSGSNQWKSDIHNDLDLNIEVKTCKKINLQDCWRQTERDAGLARSSPLLAVHFDKMPDNTWLIVMHSDDWIEYMKGEDKRELNFTDPKLKWALNTLKNSINSALKLLP